MIGRRRFLEALAASAAAAVVTRPRDVTAKRRADGPAIVLLIRHAEEPAKGPHLSDRGRERAHALIKLFDGRFQKPTALFASRQTKASERSVETLQPLAAELMLPIDNQYAQDDFKPLADKVLGDHAYNAGRVLIAWHHSRLPELAHALGVVRPPKWQETVYDALWVIRFSEGHATLSPEWQHLLPGDK